MRDIREEIVDRDLSKVVLTSAIIASTISSGGKSCANHAKLISKATNGQSLMKAFGLSIAN